MSAPYRCEEYGFRIVPRELIFNSLALECYRGATSLDEEEITAAHTKQSLLLRERVAKIEGAYVLFTPDDDADGFVLVGDDPLELDQAAWDAEISGWSA